jgi:hypothetical protein
MTSVDMTPYNKTKLYFNVTDGVIPAALLPDAVLYCNETNEPIP